MSSRQIFKYTLPMRSMVDIQMRLGAQILDIQLQDNGKFCIWALSEDTVMRERRTIRVIKTGVEILEIVTQSLDYISTVQYYKPDVRIVHFFEEVNIVDTQEAMDELCYIIIQDPGYLCWSNTLGWVARGDATQYSTSERVKCNLPIAGRWAKVTAI